MLLPTVADDPDRLARFSREAQVLASLNHPHIAHMYGIEDAGDTHALIMELVEGATLADRIADGPIPIREAMSIASQIADALAAAHEQGIIHRDLKPQHQGTRGCHRQGVGLRLGEGRGDDARVSGGKQQSGELADVHGCDSPQVGAMIDRFARGLLWRHVGSGPENDSNFGPTFFDVGKFEIMAATPAGPTSTSPLQALVQTTAIEHNAEISPNGRYLAYASNESGRFEVHVRPYPRVEGDRWIVSTAGGLYPSWAKNGRELFYVDSAGSLMALTVDTSATTFGWGKPVPLFKNRFDVNPGDRPYDADEHSALRSADTNSW